MITNIGVKIVYALQSQSMIQYITIAIGDKYEMKQIMFVFSLF